MAQVPGIDCAGGCGNLGQVGSEQAPERVRVCEAPVCDQDRIACLGIVDCEVTLRRRKRRGDMGVEGQGTSGGEGGGRIIELAQRDRPTMQGARYLKSRQWSFG